MKKTILNYKIIIEKESSTEKKGKYVYAAYCPSLGLADFGDSIDEAIKRMTDLITFHIKTLGELQYPIPVEKETTTVFASVQVPLNPSIKLSYV